MTLLLCKLQILFQSFLVYFLPLALSLARNTLIFPNFLLSSCKMGKWLINPCAGWWDVQGRSRRELVHSAALGDLSHLSCHGLPYRPQTCQQLQRGQCTDVTHFFFIGTLPWRLSIIKKVTAWTLTHLLLGWKPVETGFWQHDGNLKSFCILFWGFFWLVGFLFFIFPSFDFRILRLLGLFFCLQKASGSLISNSAIHHHERSFRGKSWVNNRFGRFTDRQTIRWGQTEKCPSYVVKLRFFNCSF